MQLDEFQRPAPQVEEVVGDFDDIPIIDIKTYLNAAENPDELTPEATIECQKVAECLHKYGILLIRDPRVNMKDNDEYLDMMEDYFEQTGELYYQGKEVKDIRPEYFYQTGTMPELTETARDHTKMRNELNFAVED